MTEHRCFTVDRTAYLRNLDRDDLAAPCVAIHYQRPPVKAEGSTSFGLRFPFLVIANYVEDREGVAQRIADILEKHWNDADAPAAGGQHG